LGHARYGRTELSERAPALTERDTRYLRAAIALAARARAAGRHPFGALVVDADDTILGEALNRAIGPDSDATGHAELEAVRIASRERAPASLSGATLYTSCEPCPMCAGAVYWSGIGRVVYALAESSLLKLTGAHDENPTFALPCREVFARGQRAIEVVGPALESEAIAPHRGFWT
jgi:tRNA(Arg) A34 adenosine deaminase TadA